MKQWILVLVVIVFLPVFVVACGGSGNVVTVDTHAMNFTQSSITLQKGQSLQVKNDASDLHILSLGRWNHGQAESEPGAPAVSNVQLNGKSSVTIGPWNTPGTYSIYCTFHQHMMLTVIVQ